MDFTNGFIQLNCIFDKSVFSVNQMLRLDFVYNRINISLLYSKQNHTDKELVLIIRMEDKDYPIAFHINSDNGKYYLNPFFKSNYTDINRIYRFLNSSRNFIPSQLFEYINEHICDFDIMTTTHTEVINTFRNSLNHECPYYYTYRRMKMSDKMKEKIREKYSNADEIINFFDKENHCTLVFTSDISKARELVLKL